MRIKNMLIAENYQIPNYFPTAESLSPQSSLEKTFTDQAIERLQHPQIDIEALENMTYESIPKLIHYDHNMALSPN